MLKVKGDTITASTKQAVLSGRKDYNSQAGLESIANVHVDALRIFESCPAASSIDPTAIYPSYNWVGQFIKGGMIEQDELFSHERSLGERFVLETQTQVSGRNAISRVGYFGACFF